MIKIIAIVQARMASTRLPGKVMTKISGKNMLWHVVKRVQYAKKIDDIVVATTSLKEDEKILKLTSEMGVKSYAGSEDDVLDRCYKAAKKYHADIIVRITGDCPVMDPHIVDKVVQYFLENRYDYVSNTIKPTYPDGLDVEVFSYNALEKAWKEAKLLSEREHVTPYFKKHPEKFRVGNVENDVDLSHLRWTVDENKDLEFIKEIFQRLYNKKSIFFMEDILQLLEEYPELKEINAEFKRNEGYLRSLKKDKIMQIT